MLLFVRTGKLFLYNEKYLMYMLILECKICIIFFIKCIKFLSIFVDLYRYCFIVKVYGFNLFNFFKFIKNVNCYYIFK